MISSGQTPSGDMFLLQLQREVMVTRHLSGVPEVGGMSSEWSSSFPDSSSNISQMYGKSLGRGTWWHVRGKQNWFPAVVSVLPLFLTFSLGEDLPKSPLSKWFMYYTEVPESLQINCTRHWKNGVGTYFPSLMAAYNSVSLFGLSIFIINGLNFTTSGTMKLQKTYL